MRLFRLRRRSVIISMDWDYAFFYPDISGDWKKAYEKAVDWLFDFLDSRSLKATMFVTPENAKLFPRHLERIVSGGHPIGLHIHSIMADTPRREKTKMLRDGTKMLEDASARAIDMYRAGMFYMDRDIVDDLVRLGYRIDSSLVPDRYVPGIYRMGKYETRHMEFNQPTDFRGYPAHPYFLKGDLLEVPPSRYCMNYFAPGPDSMIENCVAEPTRLSLIYIHPKNMSGRGLKESAGGRIRRAFAKVVDALVDRDFRFIDYRAMLKLRSIPRLTEPYRWLP